MGCTRYCTYSLVLLISGFGTHLLVYGLSYSSGVYYVMFMENLEDPSPSSVSLGTGLNTALVYGAGPLASCLINRLGCRNVGILGGFLAGVGLVLVSACRHVYYMGVMFGIVCGIGLGFSYVACTIAVAQHFRRYRPLALGFITSAVGVGSFLYPPLLHELTEYYDWRAAIYITGAITFNLLPCAALYRSQDQKASGYKSPYCCSRTESQNATKIIQNDTIEIENIVEMKNNTGKSVCRSITFFRNIHYVLFSLANILNCVGISVVFVHLAAFSNSLGFEEAQGAWLFSTIGVASFFGHFIFGALNQVRGLTGAVLWTGSQGILGWIIVLLHFVTTSVQLHVIAAMFGLLYSGSGLCIVDAVMRMVGISRLTDAYGYMLLFDAFGQALGAPIAGIIYETSGMYIASMYFGGGMIIAGSMTMLPSFFVRTEDTKNKGPYIVDGRRPDEENKEQVTSVE